MSHIVILICNEQFYKFYVTMGNGIIKIELCIRTLCARVCVVIISRFRDVSLSLQTGIL